MIDDSFIHSFDDDVSMIHSILRFIHSFIHLPNLHHTRWSTIVIMGSGCRSSHYRGRRRYDGRVNECALFVAVCCIAWSTPPSSAWHVASHPLPLSSQPHRRSASGFPLRAFGPTFRRRSGGKNRTIPDEGDDYCSNGPSLFSASADMDEDLSSAGTCIPGPSSADDEAEMREDFGVAEDDDEICVVADDAPAMPRFELPVMIRSSSEDERAPENDDDDLSPRAMDGEALGGDEGDKADDEPKCDRGIVIIDNFSPYHGNYVSRMAREAYGAGVVSALSEYVTGFLYQEKKVTQHLPDRLPDLDSTGDVERWVNEIPFEIVAIVCESDSGLDDAERLGEALGLYPDRHDGFNVARRNKFLMNKACESAGLRVVRQKMCETLEEALEFASELGVRGEADCAGDKSENVGKRGAAEIISVVESSKALDGADCAEEQVPSNNGLLGMATNDHTEGTSLGRRYCVVKPSRGVASDDVHLCPDLESVQTAFTRIKGSTVFGSMHGEKHEKVLVQEFASGTEYAIDIVSKAGHHKVAALWRYDKRPANGASFVYHATELVDADTDVGRSICEYVMDALGALNVNWGISHNEVIVDAEGPRLVEVNLRQHNTDFAPLTSTCIGYNALDMLLAAYLGDAEEFPPNTEHKRLAWDSLPDLPVTRAYGAIVHLVSHSEGILTGLNIPALEEIEDMGSVLAMELYPHYTAMGEHIEKTVDIRTDCGWLHIMNDDPEQFKSDYDRVVELMPHIFSVEKDGVDE